MWSAEPVRRIARQPLSLFASDLNCGYVGSVSGYISAGILYVNSGIVQYAFTANAFGFLSHTYCICDGVCRFTGRVRSLSVVVVQLAGTAMFEAVPIHHSLENYGLMNMGQTIFRGGQTILSGPLVSNGTVILETGQLDLNCTANQSMIGGGGITNRGGVITVRQGDLIVAAPLTSGPNPAAQIMIWGPATTTAAYTQAVGHARANRAAGLMEARLILTTANRSADGTVPASPTPYVHAIGGSGITNDGTVIVQNATLRLTAALVQSGQLLATSDAAVVFGAGGGGAESVIRPCAIPNATVAIGSLAPVTIESGARIRLVGGSRCGFTGGLQQNGWLTLDDSSGLQVSRSYTELTHTPCGQASKLILCCYCAVVWSNQILALY